VLKREDEMAKNTLHRLGATLFVLALGCLAGSMSFYFMRFPDQPDSATGRVFPLNNHGYITFLTRIEHLIQGGLFGGFFVLILIAISIRRWGSPQDR
jgi:hypothetical protein